MLYLELFLFTDTLCLQVNPQKKSDTIVRQLHDVNERFDSVVVLRAKLIEKLGDQVPNTITFDVGYYGGQHHSKIWLCSDRDLESMYQNHPTGVITLWCDGCISTTEDCTAKHKRDELPTGSSKRHKKEEQVDLVFKELKEKHGSNFDTPRLRLWARMISNSLHDDLENPPTIPAFCGTPKRPLSNAKALGESRQGSEANETATVPGRQPGVSPGKAIDLRMKNYEQLRYIQTLFDDGILSETEYVEQKQGILASIRKL